MLSCETKEEEISFEKEARAQSMDEALECLEESSPGRMQDDESGGNCERSQEDVHTNHKLDHSLLDTSDVEAWHWHLEKAKRKFGPYFLDEQQLELFCLLPLSNKQRVELLGRMRQP